MIIECLDCRAYVEAKECGSYWRHFDGRAPSCRYTLLGCSQCGSPILIRQTNIGNMAEGDKWDTPFLLFPPSDLRINPSAPRDIQAAFEEPAHAIAYKLSRPRRSCAGKPLREFALLMA
jgi:hypothetical protein